MTLDPAEVASRFLHYTAATLLFGATWFFFRELPVEYTGEGFRRRMPFRIWLMAMVLLAIASGLVWFALTTARISPNLLAAVDPEALSAVLRETDFGPLWTVRIFLGVMLVAVLLSTKRTNALHVALSAMLLASLALTGHARSEQGVIGAVHVVADALHLLAAGLWLGGLFGLVLLLAPSEKDEAAAIEALRRFAGTGSVAVATLIGTGAINTALLVGSPGAMVSTDYGRLLLGKLTLFLAMLALAATNRFRLVPRLDEAKPRSSTILALVRRNVLIEQVAGLAVLMMVAALGTWAPPSAT